MCCPTDPCLENELLFQYLGKSEFEFISQYFPEWQRYQKFPPLAKATSFHVGTQPQELPLSIKIPGKSAYGLQCS